MFTHYLQLIRNITQCLSNLPFPVRLFLLTLVHQSPKLVLQGAFVLVRTFPLNAFIVTEQYRFSAFWRNIQIFKRLLLIVGRNAVIRLAFIRSLFIFAALHLGFEFRYVYANGGRLKALLIKTHFIYVWGLGNLTWKLG
jgi:hypothetical protein